MKQYRFKTHLCKLGMTNPVSCKSGGRWGCVTVQNDGPVDPIVVCRSSTGTTLILDGNQRACCCLRHERPLDAFMITTEHDRDAILELEAEGKIRQFPHRPFLMGETTLLDLVREAERSAIHLGRTTVARAVRRFQMERGERPSQHL